MSFFAKVSQKKNELVSRPWHAMPLKQNRDQRISSPEVSNGTAESPQVLQQQHAGNNCCSLMQFTFLFQVWPTFLPPPLPFISNESRE